MWSILVFLLNLLKVSIRISFHPFTVVSVGMLWQTLTGTRPETAFLRGSGPKAETSWKGQMDISWACPTTLPKRKKVEGTKSGSQSERTLRYSTRTWPSYSRLSSGLNRCRDMKYIGNFTKTGFFQCLCFVLGLWRKKVWKCHMGLCNGGWIRAFAGSVEELARKVWR